MESYLEKFRSLVEQCGGKFICKKHRVIEIETDASQPIGLLIDDCLEAIGLCDNCVGEKGGCPIAELYWGPVLEARLTSLAWRED